VLGRVLLGLLVSGCPSPNLYGTARTVEPGKVSYTIASEGVFPREYDEFEEDGPPAPLIPVFQVRKGLTHSIDFGFRASGLTVGADAKFNFMRSRHFDLAIDPGFAWSIADLGVIDPSAYFHLPAIINVNVPLGSLVLSPGLLWAQPLALSGNDEYVAHGLHTRLGVGLNLRGSSVALQPEVTLLGDVDPPVFPADVAVGVGISFLNLPAFD
jgi:hypothetical protein